MLRLWASAACLLPTCLGHADKQSQSCACGMVFGGVGSTGDFLVCIRNSSSSIAGRTRRCCESHYRVASADSMGRTCRSPGMTADLPPQSSSKFHPPTSFLVVPESSTRHGRSTALQAVICSCCARRLRADHAAAFAARSSTRLRPQHALPQTQSLKNCCASSCVTTSPSPPPRPRMPPSKMLPSATRTRQNCASSQPLPPVPPPRTRSAYLRLVRATASQDSS